MVKQLTFGAKFAPPRPTIRSEQVKKLYIDRIVNIVADWAGENNDTKAFQEISIGVTKFVERELENYNGYEVAKKLEDYCQLDPDAELVAALDDLPYKKREIASDLLKEWIKNYNIVPLLKIGDIATSSTVQGKITSIEKANAKYTIITDDKRTYSVPFEDIKEHLAILETI